MQVTRRFSGVAAAWPEAGGKGEEHRKREKFRNFPANTSLPSGREKAVAVAHYCFYNPHM